jgi:hypothetical protein
MTARRDVESSDRLNFLYPVYLASMDGGPTPQRINQIKAGQGQQSLGVQWIKTVAGRGLKEAQHDLQCLHDR